MTSKTSRILRFSIAAFAAFLLRVSFAGPAKAADERANKDLSGTPVEIFITTGTKEIRRGKVNDAGILLIESTGTGSVSGTVTANQGTAAAASSAWPTKLTDGTDTADVTGANALKTDPSASTSPVRTDQLPTSLTAGGNLKVSVEQSPSTVPVFAAPGALFPVSDNGGSLTVDGSLTVVPGSWTTPVTSTGACGVAATLAIAAQASAKTAMFCNEGADAVRVGPAGVTATVGTLVLGSSCVGLDGPSSSFQGSLFCIRTTGSDQAFNTFQGL